MNEIARSIEQKKKKKKKRRSHYDEPWKDPWANTGWKDQWD